MRQAQSGDKVKVHYTGRLEDGNVFSTSAGSEPLVLKIGKGRYIHGFEEAILGLETGESKTVVVTPDKAFGPCREDLYMELKRRQLPKNLDPQVGQRLKVKSGGTSLVATVDEVDEYRLRLNGNHPLAGKDLIFDIELIEIL